MGVQRGEIGGGARRGFYTEVCDICIENRRLGIEITAYDRDERLCSGRDWASVHKTSLRVADMALSRPPRSLPSAT